MDGDTEGVSPLDCVICFAPYDRLFKVPKVLGCGHTFCLECLARVTVVAPDAPTLLCPICRRPTALPRRRGPPALPTRADLLALLPPGPAGSVRFSRPKGLLYVPPGHPKPPGQVPTVTLSLELGQPDPPAPPPSRGWPRVSGRWSLYRAVALTVALAVGGGLVLCGVFILFLQPMVCGEGGAGDQRHLGGGGLAPVLRRGTPHPPSPLPWQNHPLRVTDPHVVLVAHGPPPTPHEDESLLPCGL
ncbi:RING finger protein 225-like [Falco naumanni]|uniref:RING finger protein 225-like n=1 Tax=Falco naumanni TaxID=148594 RepID=UPI001ADE44A9|nr:RING finger protein 225-like [Falco naumanni]